MTDKWLRRNEGTAFDDAGSVLRAWRVSNHRTQASVAALLDTTQQHLSQIEKGTRPLSFEQRRQLVEELGIPAEELGLSGGQARQVVSRDDASPEITSSRMQWRAERRWLNRNRADLAQIAVQLYPPECRVGRTTLITNAGWMPSAPIELRTIALTLDEEPQTVVVDGSEPETQPARPFRSSGVRFERYTSAIKHLDPPQLFESRPSYRLLDCSLDDKPRLAFGLAAYFDKLDVSETLGHEIAAARPVHEAVRMIHRLSAGAEPRSTSLLHTCRPRRYPAALLVR